MCCQYLCAYLYDLLLLLPTPPPLSLLPPSPDAETPDPHPLCPTMSNYTASRNIAFLNGTVQNCHEVLVSRKPQFLLPLQLVFPAVVTHIFWSGFSVRLSCMLSLLSLSPLFLVFEDLLFFCSLFFDSVLP